MSEHQDSAYGGEFSTGAFGELFDNPCEAQEDRVEELESDVALLKAICGNKDDIIAGVLEERDALKAIIESGGAEERVVRFLLRIKDLHTQFYAKGEPFTLRMNVADSLQSLFREAGLP